METKKQTLITLKRIEELRKIVENDGAVEDEGGFYSDVSKDLLTIIDVYKTFIKVNK